MVHAAAAASSASRQAAVGPPPDPPPLPEPLTAEPPPPPTGPAMTLEQYRAYVATQSHVRGTIHATPEEEKVAREEKTRHGWWPCQSYKCSGKTLNPRALERCDACGALRRLNTGSSFSFTASAAQVRWNSDLRRK